MKSIGLPPNVIYACLAETIVLALEGRFEVFTIGRDTEWEKVKEIYKLGLKHGMKLSAISGRQGRVQRRGHRQGGGAGEEGAPDLEGRVRHRHRRTAQASGGCARPRSEAGGQEGARQEGRGQVCAP